MTGNPVRQNLLDTKLTREEALKSLGLDPKKKTILLVGGSLGARTINESVLRHLDAIIFFAHHISPLSCSSSSPPPFEPGGGGLESVKYSKLLHKSAFLGYLAELLHIVFSFLCVFVGERGSHVC